MNNKDTLESQHLNLCLLCLIPSETYLLLKNLNGAWHFGMAGKALVRDMPDEALVGVLVPLLSIHLQANGKAATDGPSAWFPATYAGKPEEAPCS